MKKLLTTIVEPEGSGYLMAPSVQVVEAGC